VGSGCARSCTNTPLGPNANTKDGCCPGTGMTSETDADCPDPAPRCGDGKKNGDEVCDPPQAACPACTDNDECTNDVMGAGQDACHPTCSHPSKNGMADGVCCPKGATMTTDPDCPAPAAMCGNDKVEGDEECDGNCGPVNDGVACTEDASLGPCKKPTHTLITTAKDGDGCCPGLDQYQDSDCPPQCGNNMKEASEECDGSAPPPATCSETCKLVEPPAAICGDGQVNRPNEECDALVLPTDTCSENCKIIEPPPVSGTSGGTSGTGAIP
jgi:hypothetical protein